MNELSNSQKVILFLMSAVLLVVIGVIIVVVIQMGLIPGMTAEAQVPSVAAPAVIDTPIPTHTRIVLPPTWTPAPTTYLLPTLLPSSTPMVPTSFVGTSQAKWTSTSQARTQVVQTQQVQSTRAAQQATASKWAAIAQQTQVAQEATANAPRFSMSVSDIVSQYYGGVLDVTGVVHNTGNITVYNLAVTVIIRDANGTQINATAYYVDSNKLDPGGSSTFDILVNDPDHKMVDIDIEPAVYSYIVNGHTVYWP